MKSTQKKSLVITAALTGLLGGTVARVNASPFQDQTKSQTAKPAVEKHSCAGKNSCKGKGGCATDGSKANKGASIAEKHACAGQNSCKGNGGCATNKKK